MVQVLCRRRKNNPLLVGEPGVGKTALAEGLALRIQQGEVPEVLKPATVYALDLGSLVAGTRYRGDFEERVKQVLDRLAKETHAIVFIDEIHTLVGAGAASGGAMDAGNLLKPALASGALRCIGSTTFSDVKQSFDKDRGLARRFQKIDVLEPTEAETLDILKGLRGALRETPWRGLCRRRARSGGGALGQAPQGSPSARQGDRRHRRSRRGAEAAARRAPHRHHRPGGDRGRSREDGPRARAVGVERRQEGAGLARRRAAPGDLRSGRRHRRGGVGDQAGAVGAARARQADRQLPVRGAHRRRQDGARAAARAHPGRRVPALRHVRVHGEACRLAPHWRASRATSATRRADCSSTRCASRRTRCCCSTKSRRRTRTCSASCCRSWTTPR